MADYDEITTTGVAELFGVNPTNLRACIDTVAGLPKPRLKAHFRMYSLPAILEWAENLKADGKDPAEIFREAYRQYQAFERYGLRQENPKIIAIRHGFLSGQFATIEQKQIIEQKRIAARQRKPAPRQIISIRPDWI